MASLYEINHEIMSCVDMETGEVIDPERLEALLIDKETKLENIACWIKNLEADALAFKAEKDAFAERQKAAETKIESLKKYLSDALQGEKFSTAKCAVSFRKSEQVEVDEKLLPKKFLTKTVTFKPDKTAIKALLKNGTAVKGAKLIEKLNPQIK